MSRKILADGVKAREVWAWAMTQAIASIASRWPLPGPILSAA